MSNRYADVNDIMLKFIEPTVYDAQEQKEQYVDTKEQFKNYIKSKQITQPPPPNIPEKDNKTVQKSSTDDVRYIRTRTRFLNIDSRDRDKLLYPYPNDYVINVGKENFSNVAKVELFSTKFINIRELIKDTPTILKNNIIKWQMLDDVSDGHYNIYTAEINPGNYTAYELEKEIEKKMMATTRVNDDGKDFYFNVTIDTLSDLATIDSLNYTTLDNPFTVMNPNIIQVYFPNHGFIVGQIIWITNAIFDDFGISLLFQNLVNAIVNALQHTITNVIDANTFEFTVPLVVFPSTVADIGGNNVQIAGADDFKLLFDAPYSINEILDFPAEETDFTSLQYNSIPTVDVQVWYILPGDKTGTSVLTTTSSHGLQTGDIIRFYPEIPLGSLVPAFVHLYAAPALGVHSIDAVTLTTENNTIRQNFVNLMTDSNGLFVTVLNDTQFSVDVEYGNYTTGYFQDGHFFTVVEIINDYVIPFPTTAYSSGTIKKTKIDLFGDQYFLMCSETLGDANDFAVDNDNVTNPFAKIYLAGDPYDTVFNSHVGGKKTYYSNALSALEDIDISFVYNDGSLVDFLDTEHSFVLRITELIQKIEGSDYNSKIGSYEFNAQKFINNTLQ